jgi:hypothetical protein
MMGNQEGDPEEETEKRNEMEVVRLKHEWHGYPVGTIVKVNDDCANTMFQSDAAERMETETSVAIKVKLQRVVADRRLKTINKSK